MGWHQWLVQVAFALHFGMAALLVELLRLALLRVLVTVASARGYQIHVQPG